MSTTAMKQSKKHIIAVVIMFLAAIQMYSENINTFMTQDTISSDSLMKLSHSEISDSSKRNLAESRDRQISDALSQELTMKKDSFGIIKSLETPNLTLYDFPYSVMKQMKNWKRLGINTGVFIGAGCVTLGVLECLPEDATAWNKEELRHTSFWHRYGNHVKAGPVWDKDNAIFNYVLHPYGGAVYYMSARSNGFNMIGSFLYSAFVSSVLWEYGIEAFMEIPSKQDLIVTPVAGTLIGEGFYRLKRHIVAHGYSLFGSKALGKTVAWFIDPINEFVNLFAGNPCKHRKATVCWAPTLQTVRNHSQIGFSAIITFD